MNPRFGRAYARRSREQRVQHWPELGTRLADDLQHFGRRALLLQRLVQLARSAVELLLKAGSVEFAAAHGFWRITALWPSGYASPVFHRIAVCCARVHSSHAAAATPRIPGKPRRFMTGPGSGTDIVSAQTNALEGARTGFVQPLSRARSMTASVVNCRARH